MADVITFYADCGHSPAWRLMPKAIVELDEAGYGFHPYQPPVWNDPCLLSQDDRGEVTGFLIYRSDDARSTWFILLAYVVPEFRRRGVHTALFTGLVERAEKRSDILAIDSGTHVDNRAAQAAFAAQGRLKAAIMYEYRLRDWIAGKPHIEIPATTEDSKAATRADL